LFGNGGMLRRNMRLRLALGSIRIVRQRRGLDTCVADGAVAADLGSYLGI
jgi:hypothetical protein